jgi:hypothetical protein
VKQRLAVHFASEKQSFLQTIDFRARFANDEITRGPSFLSSPTDEIERQLALRKRLLQFHYIRRNAHYLTPSRALIALHGICIFVIAQ